MPLFRVFSFHQGNHPDEMLAAQRAVFAKVGVPLEQYYAPVTYGECITRCLMDNRWDAVALFDLDAFVKDARYLHNLLETSLKEFGITGGAQNANHRRDSLDYASAACCVFSRDTWNKAGVGFQAHEPDDGRGWMDVGQRFTESIREQGGAVNLTMPVHVDRPHWRLHNGEMFGIGTDYGWVYHHFNGSNPERQPEFVAKCREMTDIFI